MEAWLGGLSLARGSRAKIRNVLCVLFNHACRHELFDLNPIRFVRQSAKRRRAPGVLTGPEIKGLVENLPLRERTLVLLAASTGLTQGELFGLKWRDIDFEHGDMNVIRSIVCGVEGCCKTESSQKPVPMHPQLAAALIAWREQCRFKTGDDWVFASRFAQRANSVLGIGNYASLHPAACRKAGDSKAHWVAHVSSHLLHVAQKPRSRIQSHAGTDETFFAALYTRRVHAGCLPSEAGRASRCAFAVLHTARFA